MLFQAATWICILFVLIPVYNFACLISPVWGRHETDLVWLWIMGCWHTYDYCVNVIGAAQTLALYWSLLSSHCRKNGRGREQCLTYPRSHSHQPKQVHCVRPLSHGEDHLREAQCGAWSSHSLNLSTPLLLSLHISVCWEVNISFSFAYFCRHCWCIKPVGSLHGVG